MRALLIICSTFILICTLFNQRSVYSLVELERLIESLHVQRCKTGLSNPRVNGGQQWTRAQRFFVLPLPCKMDLL